MLQEAREIARPCAARVYERRASAAGETQWIDPERRATSVDMGVEVDEARRDDQAADILDLNARKLRADRGDPAVLEANVRHRVDSLRWVDNSPPSKNQIMLHQDHL